MKENKKSTDKQEEVKENVIKASRFEVEQLLNPFIGNIKITNLSKEDKISSFNVYQTITITTNKVDSLSNISLELSKISLKLPKFVVDTPEYYLTDIEKYKSELINSAANNAKNTAIDVLKVSHKELGDLKNLTQDDYKIYTTIDLNSNKSQKSDELSSINKVIRANVTATYVIK